MKKKYIQKVICKTSLIKMQYFVKKKLGNAHVYCYMKYNKFEFCTPDQMQMIRTLLEMPVLLAFIVWLCISEALVAVRFGFFINYTLEKRLLSLIFFFFLFIAVHF